MKQKWISFLLFALCFVVLLSTVSPALAQKDKTVVYEYALLGEEYTPEQGLVSASTPTGETINKNADRILLDWAQGSYLFEYEDKTVNLKVYESAPADSLSHTEKVPQIVANGVSTQFPGLTVQSGIRRTDGAPKVENYAVSAILWHNGQRVQTVRSANDPFSFTPNETGLWLLTYVYTDVFGVTRNVNYPFTVTDQKVIVSSFREQYFVGQSISASDAYGYYQGKNYPVQLLVTAPDGIVTEVTERYTLASEGTYTLSYSAQIEGEKVAQTTAVTVTASLQSFLTDVDGFDSGTVGQRHENAQTMTSSDEGLVLNMTSTTAAFRYNGVIDLKELGKNTPVISFQTNHSYGGSISNVEVTLTDVYDPGNTLTVQFSRNSDMSAESMNYDNTLVSASFGNTTVGANNYQALSACAVAWDTTFHSYWRSADYESSRKTYGPAESTQSFNFAYDSDAQVVYSYGNYHLVGWEESATLPEGYPTTTGVDWYPVANLQGSKLVNKFAGFTTGEVYLDLTVTSGRGDVIVYSIGGVDMDCLAESYSDDNGLILGRMDQGLPAIQDVPYEFPDVSGAFVTETEITVTKDGKPVSCQGNSFTPTETGEYTVLFRAINQFGMAISKEKTITVIEKPELTVTYPASSVKMGELYTVQEPVTSGYGEVQCAITVNGKQVKPGDKLKVAEEMNVTVTATDLLGSKEITMALSVDRDYVEFTGDFPRSALCGTEFTFPEITAYDHQTGQTLDCTVSVNGQKQNGTIVLPQEPAVLKVEYQTQRGSKSYELYVRPAEVISGSDALILPESAKAETNDSGTMVTVGTADPVVRMPYMLSATSLPVQFIVLEEDLNYNTMTVRMTDGSGTCVTVSVVGLQENDPHLYINGIDTLVSLTKQAQSIATGENEGKTFYAYTLEYHDMYRAMLNSSKVLATVEKTVDGLTFDQFQSGVYLDIYPEDMQGSTATFGITRIGNQYFYASAFEYGDIVAPTLSTTDFFIGNNNVESGYVLKLSGLKAYDVLQPGATVEVTLILPDGTVVCQNADPATVEDTVFDKVGTYMLKIKATDTAGVKLDASYRFTVEDDQGPEITVSGSVAQTAKKGKSLTVPGASAKDTSAVTIRIAIFDPTGKVTIFNDGADTVGSVTLEKLKAGVYHIRYIATDENDNVTTEVFTVTVEE